jgi:hypothetical protein
LDFWLRLLYRYLQLNLTQLTIVLAFLAQDFALEVVLVIARGNAKEAVREIVQVLVMSNVQVPADNNVQVDVDKDVEEIV